MSHPLSDPFFSSLSRAGYVVATMLVVAIGDIWVYWHPIETVMDVAAPLTTLFLVFARDRGDVFVKLSLASCVVLVAAMLAAAKWMTIPA